jgi:predicted DNA-binding transcriptional regulator AlpA
MPETYLTEKEFCKTYKLSIHTARSWRYSGLYGPKYVRLGGNRIAYRVSDCEEWAAARTFTSRAEEMVSKAA